MKSLVPGVRLYLVIYPATAQKRSLQCRKAFYLRQSLVPALSTRMRWPPGLLLRLQNQSTSAPPSPTLKHHQEIFPILCLYGRLT